MRGARSFTALTSFNTPARRIVRPHLTTQDRQILHGQDVELIRVTKYLHLAQD
jgi:hypothetical protein